MRGYGNWRPRQTLPLAMPKTGHPAAMARLRPRDWDTLLGICAGLSDCEMAVWFGISEGGMGHRCNDLYAKLGVHSRVEAILWAWSHVMPLLDACGLADRGPVVAPAEPDGATADAVDDGEDVVLAPAIAVPAPTWRLGGGRSLWVRRDVPDPDAREDLTG